ncbi:MAG: TlpA family protein disulfide reductase [Rhizomicrobium sp.]
MQTRFLATAAAIVLAVGVLYGIGHIHAKPGLPSPLALQAKPVMAPLTAFADASGGQHSLAEFKGHYVLLNLWATWCAPCVAELPALAKLRNAVPALKVVAVDVGHDKSDVAAAFLERHHVGELGTYVDSDLALLHAFGAYGLPTTILIDPQGREIAEAEGPGEWAKPQAVAYFKALTKTG